MDIRETVSNQTHVALSVTKHLLQTDGKDSNVVFSPASIHVVLSLIAAGSKGTTLDQLLSFLKAKSSDQLNSFASELVPVVLADGSSGGGPRLSFANCAWVEMSLPLKPSFEQIVGTSYKATLNQVDFQYEAAVVTGQVNAWAEKETRGLIKQVLPPGSVDSTTKLIFANALYFKGAWSARFDASKTKDHDFHLLNGSSVRVPFMTSWKKQVISAYDGFKVLALPYKQGEDKRRFSMYFFLPDAKDGLPALVDKVGSQHGFLERHLPRRQVEVGDFRIPRFKISFGFKASNTLKGLGVVLPFSDEGDLSEMVGSPEGQRLRVSEIFHKSFIEVNEEGTEAAAASAGVIMFSTSLRQSYKIDFVADHPFLFLIREDMTGMVLFSGQVVNPLES
ncbi:Serpin family [Trema orientale]|uniref:Serpin family n=1 Tax=Trema orientale TaxID=63057 RepID=A0A2P5FN15_TREOI|nr:Serpin family [Trema orientale]